MKARLAAFSLAAMFALIGVSVWASGHQGIVAAVRDIQAQPTGGNNPWMIATLFDAYFAFLWFWLWVAYKETGWLARGVWLVLVLTLGNIAMAIYMLLQLWRLPANATVEQLLLRRSAR